MPGLGSQFNGRRGRRMLLRRLTVAVLIATTGCHRLPRYEVTTAAFAAGASAATPTTITVSDDRPAWERKFYLAGHDGVFLKNEVSFVPAESVDPQPWEILRREVAAKFATAPVQPVQIDLTVRSFRTVVDLNYRGSSERTAQWEFERPQGDDLSSTLRLCADSPAPGYPNYGDDPNKLKHHCDDDDDGWLIVAGAAAVFLGCWYAGECVRDGARRVGHAVNLRPGEPGPPEQLADLDYARGVTFEIVFDAQTTFAAGEVATTRVEQSIYLPAKENSPEKVRHAIAVGLSEAAAKLVRQTFNLPPPETSPLILPIPPTVVDLPRPTSLPPVETGVKEEMERLQREENERLSRISNGQPLR